MGWVAIKRANDPEVYLGIDADFVDICDLCNYVFNAAKKYAITQEHE